MTPVWAMAGVYAWPLLVRDLRWVMLLRNCRASWRWRRRSARSRCWLGLAAVSAVLIVTARRLGAAAVRRIWALTENVALGRLVRIFRARQEALAEARDEQAQSNA